MAVLANLLPQPTPGGGRTPFERMVRVVCLFIRVPFPALRLNN